MEQLEVVNGQFESELEAERERSKQVNEKLEEANRKLTEVEQVDQNGLILGVSSNEN